MEHLIDVSAATKGVADQWKTCNQSALAMLCITVRMEDVGLVEGIGTL